MSFAWLSALLGLGACVACAVLPQRYTPIPLTVAEFTPGPLYQVWAQDVIDCAKSFKDSTPNAPYRVVHDSVNVRDFVWLAVVTENSDGGFPCWIEGKVQSCAGRQDGADTILISSQFLERRWVVKHEVLHWAVESPNELKARHGFPWGLCEFWPT